MNLRGCERLCVDPEAADNSVEIQGRIRFAVARPRVTRVAHAVPRGQRGWENGLPDLFVVHVHVYNAVRVPGKY